MFINADSRMIPLADKSVNCVVTSPPYYGLRSYETTRWIGGDSQCKHSPADTPQKRGLESSTLCGGKKTTGHQQESWRGDTCPRCGARRVDDQIGLESSITEYVEKMVGVFREV